MVKRARNQITQNPFNEDNISSDIWEQQFKQRTTKKKKYSLLPNPCFFSDEQTDFKNALMIFNNIKGEENFVDYSFINNNSNFAVLHDGSILQIINSKIISCPAKYNTCNLCFFGRVYIKVNSINLSSINGINDKAFSNNEVFQSDYYKCVLENQIKKDTQIKFIENKPTRQLIQPIKNSYTCRYHYYSNTNSIDHVLLTN